MADLSREALLARREQLFQNKQTTERMLHNIEGAVLLLNALLAEDVAPEAPDSPKEPDHDEPSQPTRS